MSQLIDIKVPDIGDFTDVPVIEVFVKPGDVIKIDDALVTLESDKATMDVPASTAGVVKEVLVKLGDRIGEGAVVVRVEASDMASAAVAAAPAPAPASEPAPAAPQAAAPAGNGGVVDVKVPDIGDFAEVPVIEIFVKPGDSVKVDDALLTLTDDELRSMRGLEPDVSVNARVGTRLWLGDGAALSARGTILAVHPVGRRFAVGYRQRKASSDGLLLVVGGGTSHGVAMAAPTPAASLRQRAIAAGTGALEATGRSRSPFQWGDKLLWFAEPPHMQVSMLWLPESTLREGLANGLRSPSVGDTLDCRVRHTTALFDAVLDGMDEWNKNTHGRSGLIERVKASTIDEAAAEARYLDFMREYTPSRTSPMCGNSIGQDRRFMARYMPKLEAYFHYRNLDVSTLKELARRWKPEISRGVVKHGKHEALADIYESIEELKYYRDNFLRL